MKGEKRTCPHCAAQTECYPVPHGRSVPMAAPWAQNYTHEGVWCWKVWVCVECLRPFSEVWFAEARPVDLRRVCGIAGKREPR